jgi:hypothetical protein
MHATALSLLARFGWRMAMFRIVRLGGPAARWLDCATAVATVATKREFHYEQAPNPAGWCPQPREDWR